MTNYKNTKKKRIIKILYHRNFSLKNNLISKIHIIPKNKISFIDYFVKSN